MKIMKIVPMLLLLIVSPCNPTGAVYDEKTLRALAALAVEHDLWLVTDDIYRTLIYGEATFVQPATRMSSSPMVDILMAESSA